MLGVLGTAPRIRRWRGGTEPEQVECRRALDAVPRRGVVEDGSEVEVRALPAVQRQHRGRSGAPCCAEQATAGERLQHRHTLPIASPPVEPQEVRAGGSAIDDHFAPAVATLTESQRRAVESPASALCIVAGAGSGKTRVLTLRVARRIRDGTAEADHTAVCTFTRKAAHELRGRLRLYGVPVSAPAATGGAPGPGVRAGTLHQLALTLLRRRARDAGHPPPVVVEHRFRIIGGIVADPVEASVVDTEVGWAKARCLTPETYAGAALDAGRTVMVGVEQVTEAFAAYEEALRRRRSLDLDDVLVHSADLLHDDPGFAEGMRWRYRHLSVDEFQDVNPAQFRLIGALLGSRNDLCVVGDPNQAIYGWNGADPRLLARLPEVVPAMELVRLDENHRSTPQVVAAATAALGRSVAVPPDRWPPTAPCRWSPPMTTTTPKRVAWWHSSRISRKKACCGRTRPCWPAPTTSSPPSAGRCPEPASPTGSPPDRKARPVTSEE